ncbi:Abi family protein, partial [Streptococcus danieliae]|nr:Abi family protein [Streptococcus danieliae]
MKKHKTFNRQLGILRERGMTVPTSSKKFLVEENYYNVINGYKDLFLKVDQDG